MSMDITTNDYLISVSNSNNIINKIRGLNPWPTAYTFYEGKKVKILEAKKFNRDYENKYQIGNIIDVNKNGILVNCADKPIWITKIQFENQKVMEVKDYINGNKINVNVKLG